MTTDQGETWSQVVIGKYGENISCINVDKNGNYYAIKDSTCLKSDDGTSWIENTFKRKSCYWESLSIDVNDDVYLGTSQNGLSFKRLIKSWD
jgi:hypothetical protein